MKTKVYVGMDVHKESVTVAVLVEGEREPALVKRLSHDPRGLRPGPPGRAGEWRGLRAGAEDPDSMRARSWPRR